LKVFLLMIIAFLITKLINHHHLLSIENVINFDLNFFFVLIEILIINVGLGHFFIKFNTFLKRITKKYSNNFFIKYRSFFVTPIIILLSFFTINMTGAGGKIISSISTYTIISYLIFVLLFRFLNINVAANSNVTGGLIVPILSLGALSGQIINIYATRYQNFDQSNWPIVILISSIMLFSLIIKTPITGTILLYSTISYLTNDYLSSLFYMPVIFIIYFIGTIFSKRILKDKCLYDELLLENDFKG
ncbi:MAG: chloride channel protein, partial [Candidatus Onthovivens sp.]